VLLRAVCDVNSAGYSVLINVSAHCVRVYHDTRSCPISRIVNELIVDSYNDSNSSSDTWHVLHKVTVVVIATCSKTIWHCIPLLQNHRYINNNTIIYSVFVVQCRIQYDIMAAGTCTSLQTMIAPVTTFLTSTSTTL
jgi:hypothetical protein